MAINHITANDFKNIQYNSSESDQAKLLYIEECSQIWTQIKELKESLSYVGETIQKGRYVVETKSPIPNSKAYLFGKCIVIIDDDLKHLSISNTEVIPTFEQINYARTRFLPLNKVYMIQYKNCIYHLFEKDTPSFIDKILSRLGVIELI